MLDHPKLRTKLPFGALALVVSFVGASGYWLGRRSTPGGAPPRPLQLSSTPTAPAPKAPGTVAATVSTAIAPPAAVVAPREPLGGPRRLEVEVAGSLDQTIEAHAPPEVGPALAMVTARLLVWWMRPAQDPRPGDKLELLYETLAGQEPRVLALGYSSQRTGRELRAFRYQLPGSPFARYYTQDGAELEERLVDGPIEGYEQVTSLLRDGRGHKGVDFKAPLGTPVRSPIDGTILRRNWHWRANGNCLELVDRVSGRHVIFLHLEELPKAMQPGVKVHRGEQVARSGNTGHTTAPHLHYQLMSAGGRVLDPFRIHETRRISLPPSELAPFRAEVTRLAALLEGSPERHVAR